MNVYDFDGTIYDGDSTIDFFLFSVKKQPGILRFVPKQVWGAILFCFGKIGKTRLKEYFFSFLSEIDSAKTVNEFWDTHQNKIRKWYSDQKQADDIIISASPEFLLKPICDRLGVTRLIASCVDPQSGRFTGSNCKGQEKVNRLWGEYSVSRIDCFYSDSASDQPLADIADKAFRVSSGVIKEWKKT